MKYMKNSKLFMPTVLLLQIATSFAYGKQSQEEIDRMMQRLNAPEKSRWIPTGPMQEETRLAIRDSICAKGSLEDKLINAAKNGKFKDVEIFIKAGANLEARCSQYLMTPLMYAAQEGYTDIVKILLDAGADMRTQNGANDPAIAYALSKNHANVVKIFISKENIAKENLIYNGEKLDTVCGFKMEDVEAYFHAAVLSGNFEMVKALAVDSVMVRMKHYQSSPIHDNIYDVAKKCRERSPKIFDIICKFYGNSHV